jgi:hypothetical protein
MEKASGGLARNKIVLTSEPRLKSLSIRDLTNAPGPAQSGSGERS